MNLGITPINFFQFALGSHPCWITMYFGSILLWLKKLFLFCFVVNFGGGRVLTNLLEASIEQAGYTSRKKVLTDVFLEVRKGELVGLIGANGAGKSTAIKAILGLSEDFKGHIAWNDCSFAYIPEYPSFYEELTLWEHLDLISTLHGIEEREFAHRAQSLLQTFSLDHVKHELPVTFSKGMQQKLMLIQAFLSKPDMYVIDEPFIGLDPISTKRFVDMLKAEKERGAGILMCTHVLDTAEKICDRFYMIEKGSLFLQGTLKDIQDKTGLEGQSLLDCFYKAVQGDRP